MPAGEAHKTRATWAELTDGLLAAGCGRDTVIVAVGGGVVGDVAGFVAATYLRGVPVVQVPTSLLAMIDAAIGGKTAVDVPAGKNLVGAFHPPALIAIDPPLLATLPARELRAGLAEAIKHGAIRDAAYLDALAPDLAALGDPAQATSPVMRALIERSVAIKAAVVAADPTERGERAILNFGHTLGHAIEAASGFALRHGEAIAIGMVLEARLGERLGVTARGVADRLEALLTDAGLPTHSDLPAADLLARTRTDKKNAAGRVRYALPADFGVFKDWVTPVDDSDVLTVLSAS
jgi:3-dehydroquinate synthase